MFTLLFWSVCASLFSLAQTNDSLGRVLSNYEKFISRTNVTISTEETTVGRTRMAHVTYLKATDLANRESAESILISLSGASYWQGTAMLYIDKSEVAGVIEALQLFKTEMEKGRPASTAAFYYSTRNKVVASCFYVPTGLTRGWYLNIYQRHERYPDAIPGTRMEFRERDIDEIIELFLKANAWLRRN